MGDASGREGVGQRLDQRLLPDQAGEILRAVFARKDAIGLLFLGRRVQTETGFLIHDASITSGPARSREIRQDVCGKVETGDPRRIRYGCSVPGLTRLASGAPTGFRAGI